jgi:hypothetical protein
MATAVQTALPGATVGFFERKIPSALILMSFPLLTIPLATALIVSTDRRFLLVYIWLFGLTHFVLTLSIYLQSENLRHFTATNKNILLYFVIPLAILMGFYVSGVLGLRSVFPPAAVVVAAISRLLDFNPLPRQSFGVFQLFKARCGVRVPPTTKRAENLFFATLSALLLITYLAGGVSPLLSARGAPELGTAIATTSPALLPIGLLRGLAVVASIVAIGLGTYSVASAIRTWREGGRKAGLREALAYLAFQTIAAILAVVSSPLYFATLSIHYVEYHVLMFPRCFHAELKQGRGLDAWFAGLRRHRALFYGIVLFAAAVVMYIMVLQENPTAALRANPIRYRAVVSIFDGLFVFHYFVEMLIWRFNDPFFRRTLTPLYFSLKPKAA